MKKLNRWLVNDVTAQAYKDGKADGRADAIAEIEKSMHEAYKGTSHEWECMIFDLKMRELKEKTNDN